MVVSNIFFYFHPEIWGGFPFRRIFMNIFQMGWNHQLVLKDFKFSGDHPWVQVISTQISPHKTWICFCWWCFYGFYLGQSPFFTTICGIFFIFLQAPDASKSKINSFPALDRRIAFYSSYSPSTAPFSIITSGIQTWFVPQKLTLKLTAKAPENRPGPERKLTFQPSIFRCYVSFTEGREMIQS